MDISYYELDYVEFHYYNYTAQAQIQMTALDIQLALARVIHLMAALTYKIREETRTHKIRGETAVRLIAEETRIYTVKET